MQTGRIESLTTLIFYQDYIVSNPSTGNRLPAIILIFHNFTKFGHLINFLSVRQKVGINRYSTYLISMPPTCWLLIGSCWGQNTATCLHFASRNLKNAGNIHPLILYNVKSFLLVDVGWIVVYGPMIGVVTNCGNVPKI